MRKSRVKRRKTKALRYTNGDIYHLLFLLNRKVDRIMVTQQEATARLNAIADKLDKIGSETSGLKQLIADLRAQLESQGALSPEAEAALVAVEAKAKSVDELVDDAAPPA